MNREWRIYTWVPDIENGGAWAIQGRGTGDLAPFLTEFLARRDDGQEVRIDWCNDDEPRDHTSMKGLA